MIHPIFPSRKPRTDALIFALGALSLVLCFLLRDYWIFKPLEPTFQERLTAVSDSVIAKSGLVRDSVEIMTEASVDTELLDTLKSRYGAGVRMYLDTAEVQQVLYRVKISKKEKGSTGINFSSGNRERRRSKSDQSVADENFLRTLWLNEHGNIVGATQYLNDSLPRGTDTNAVRERLIGLIPEAFRRQPLVWVADTNSSEKFGFVALLGKDSLLKKELSISATRVSTSPVVWSVEWQRRVSIIAPSRPANDIGGGLSAKTIVTIIFWVIVIICVFGLGIVWINRLRIKAVNIWILGISVLTGFSWTAYVMGVTDIPWVALIVVFIFYTLGFGFFFISVPIASIVSVMREVIPEKFYTIMRLRDNPLGSFHVGRMLLFGVSIGALYSAIVLLLPYMGERYGIPSLAVLHLKSDYYTLPFMLRSAIGSIANVIGGVMSISFIVGTIPVMLAYWLLPRKYAVLFALLLTSLLWGLFEATRGLDASPILAQAIIRGWLGFAVLYFGDILALVAFVAVESFLVSIGTFASHPMLLVCLGVLLLLGIVLGAIAYQKNAPEPVNEADFKPNFVSLLEENERMHQEIAAAKSVQQKLLPRSLPTFDSVVVSAACIPAYEVGGDYYDFFPLDDKRLGVLIGDVSGKGISAAFYITLAKGVIVSQVRNVGSPSDVLHRVNSLLYGVMERGKFVSMIYGIYNTHSREFSFSNAGHNPLVVRRVNGEIQTISAKGMAIGLDKGERFERAVTTASLTLEKGDCILLYTDGVTEAMNTNHAEYGEERMMQAIQAAPLNAADIISAALADVRKFAGKAHQHDDITLVALQAV
jgi:hypothetical protein